MSEKNKQPNKTVTKHPILMNKVLCNGVYYFNGHLSKLAENKQSNLVFEQTTVTDKTLPLLIVSREYYTEQVKTYPLTHKKDVNKLLQLELSDSDNSAYHIWPVNEQQTPVNVWTFSAQVPKAFITIPETLLIAVTHTQPQVSVVERDKPLFVGRLNNLVHSAIANTVINTPERFAISTGVQSGELIHTINSQNFVQTLISAFNKHTFNWLFSFINVKTTLDYKKQFKKIALPFTGIFASYLLLTSGYLLISNMQLKNALSNQKTEVNQALNQQQAYDDKLAKYTQLTDFLTTQKNSAQLWLMLPELFSQAHFSNIRLEKGRFILRGSTEQATELLSAISKKENVTEATFDYPTRSSRGKDIFVISFLIKTQASNKEDVESKQEENKQVDLAQESNNG